MTFALGSNDVIDQKFFTENISQKEQKTRWAKESENVLFFYLKIHHPNNNIHTE